MSAKSQGAAFAAIAGLYLLACLLTVGTGGHPRRPIYEGIGPSTPYRWVRPPPAFKSTNVAPIPSSQSVALTAAGSEQAGAGTIDGQLVLNLPAAALPPSPGQHNVLISMTPKDPATLGPLPAGLYSDGNAYLVAAFYQPSQAAIPSAVKPIDLVIRTPVPSTALLFSVDGQTWVRIQDHHIPGQAAVAATFTGFGHLLAATNVPVVTSPLSGGSRTLVLVLLGVAAVGAVGFSVAWRIRRQRR